MMTQLINAIAQYEAKLKTPIMIDVFHLVASGKSPNMEIGTTIPTKIDKASVTLKDPKRPFPLFTLHLPYFHIFLSMSAKNWFSGSQIVSTTVAIPTPPPPQSIWTAAFPPVRLRW